MPRREASRLARFAAVGCAGVVIDMSAYAGLLALGVAAEPAKAMSYLAGMTFGFVGNKFWTFGSRRKSASEPALYVAVYGTTLVVNTAVNAWLLGVLGADQKPAAFVAATAVSAVMNFAGLRWLAFRKGVDGLPE